MYRRQSLEIMCYSSYFLKLEPAVPVNNTHLSNYLKGLSPALLQTLLIQDKLMTGILQPLCRVLLKMRQAITLLELPLHINTEFSTKF